MMSETSSKKFGSELDNLRKWRDGGENSAADATDPASKERVSQSQKDSQMDRTGETADGGEMSKPESWRSDGAEYSRQHRPERFSDRSHRNPMRSHPYGRSYRPAGSQGYYNKPYYTRNTGGRDVGARSYLAGGRISRFPRREYRPGYVGAPEKLYYHGSSSRGFGMYPNIHRYASNLSQMFPLVNPPPLYLSSFSTIGAAPQPRSLYNAPNFPSNKIYINPSKLAELQNQGLDLKLLQHGRWQQQTPQDDSGARYQRISKPRLLPQDSELRGLDSDRKSSLSKQNFASEPSKPSNPQQSPNSSTSHWRNESNPLAKDGPAFDNRFQTIAEDLKNYPNNNEEELTLQLHTDSSDRVPHSITISQLDSGVTQQHLESMAGNFPNFHVGFFPLLCICLLLTPAFLLKVNRDDPGLWLSESIFL